MCLAEVAKSRVWGVCDDTINCLQWQSKFQIVPFYDSPARYGIAVNARERSAQSSVSHLPPALCSSMSGPRAGSCPASGSRLPLHRLLQTIAAAPRPERATWRARRPRPSRRTHRTQPGSRPAAASRRSKVITLRPCFQGIRLRTGRHVRVALNVLIAFPGQEVVGSYFGSVKLAVQIGAGFGQPSCC